MTERCSRREFLSLRRLFKAAEECATATRGAIARKVLPDAATPRQQPPRRPAAPVLRPPRAVAEELFTARCTACEDCATACPHQAITTAPAHLRLAGPVINPHTAPCLSCEDTPCVTACTTGALDPALPIAIGTAHVNQPDCIANTGCALCRERCPVPGALRFEGGKPVIDSTTCTGCGVCAYICPAPRRAIMILPTRVRPTPMEPA